MSSEKALSFDPRSKLAVIIVLSIVVMGGCYQTDFYYLPAFIPLIFLLFEKRLKNIISYVLIFAVCMALQNFLLPNLKGVVGFLMAAVSVLPLYFLPTIATAKYMISTTTAGEFISSMEKMHMPKGFTISMAVIFRFFPTVIEEWRSIESAMSMRGIALCGKKAGKFLEYRLVPVLMCSIKIGEELSAAALTRGLDSNKKRTCIHNVRLKIQDYIILFICLAILAVQIYFWIVR